MEKLPVMFFAAALLQVAVYLSHIECDPHMFRSWHPASVFGIDHCGTEQLPEELFVMLQQPFITTRQPAVGLFHPAQPFDFAVQRFQ